MDEIWIEQLHIADQAVPSRRSGFLGKVHGGSVNQQNHGNRLLRLRLPAKAHNTTKKKSQ